MRRTALLSVAALVIVLVAGAAAAVVAGVALPGGTGPTPADTPTAVMPSPVETTPTAVPTATTPGAASTPAPASTSGLTDDVATVQQQLTDLGYYVGPVDGVAGPATASAVQAFQKVHGLRADGVIGPNTIAALADPVQPRLRGGPPDRIEVDLDHQVMYLVRDDRLVRILPISSGSGDTYTTASGGTARSLTPVGDFTVERRIDGVRNAPLGTLYDPLYFYRGWAIHGSNSVPAHPASHGCVRVTRADARWLFDRVPVGTTVSVYGNTNAFSPALGEGAGTSEPAGDTPDTTPDDGIQTEEPTPVPSPTPTPTPEPQPTPTGSATPSPPPSPTPSPSATASDPEPTEPAATETGSTVESPPPVPEPR